MLTKVVYTRKETLEEVKARVSEEGLSKLQVALGAVANEGLLVALSAVSVDDYLRMSGKEIECSVELPAAFKDESGDYLILRQNGTYTELEFDEINPALVTIETADIYKTLVDHDRLMAPLEYYPIQVPVEEFDAKMREAVRPLGIEYD